MGHGADAVVYVHGLWMPGVEGALLLRRLTAQRGFRCQVFRYRSVRETMSSLALSLRQMVARIEAPRVHLVVPLDHHRPMHAAHGILREAIEDREQEGTGQ